MKIRIVYLIAITLLAFSLVTWGGDDESSYSDSIIVRFENNLSLDSMISAYSKYIDKDSIKSYMEQLVAFKTRFMLADNRKDIALFIGDRFKSFGYEDIKLDSFQNTVEFPMGSGKQNTTWQYNVAATLTGSKNPGDCFILGAHYDCMIMGPEADPYKSAPGANNNASGVAVCLEIARIFKQSKFVPANSIEFVAFGSEEFMTMFISGGSGAQHYVGQLKESGKTARLMIDNNQISYSPDTARWKLDFQNYPGAEWVTDLAHYVCDNYTKITPVDTDDHIMFTDSRYFHESGIPAIFFEEYHFNPFTFTEDDTVENCNIEYCTEVARISCGMLVYLNY